MVNERLAYFCNFSIIPGAGDVSVTAILEQGFQFAGLKKLLSLGASADPLATNENLRNLKKKEKLDWIGLSGQGLARWS